MVLTEAGSLIKVGGSDSIVLILAGGFYYRNTVVLTHVETRYYYDTNTLRLLFSLTTARAFNFQSSISYVILISYGQLWKDDNKLNFTLICAGFPNITKYMQ